MQVCVANGRVTLHLDDWTNVSISNKGGTLVADYANYTSTEYFKECSVTTFIEFLGELETTLTFRRKVSKLSEWRKKNSAYYFDVDQPQMNYFRNPIIHFSPACFKNILSLALRRQLVGRQLLIPHLKGQLKFMAGFHCTPALLSKISDWKCILKTLIFLLNKVASEKDVAA